MSDIELPDRTWKVRAFIYRFFVDHDRPPTVAETARQFAMPVDAARDAYTQLAAAHQMVLEPGSDEIRMASPLSTIPTPYQVVVGDHRYYANCAWDSLGIPAMLGADARIEAHDTLSGELVRFTVEAGELRADGGYVHFSVPVRDWYGDLIHT